MQAVGYLVLTFRFSREGEFWTGVCVELGTSTYGETLPEVHAELSELVAEHLNLLESHGERERFFEEFGVRIQTMPTSRQMLSMPVGKSEPDASAPAGTESFTVPEILPMQYAIA